MKSLGTMVFLSFCLTGYAAEPSSPSEMGSAVRGPMPGEFSEPGSAPAGPGATRRMSDEPEEKSDAVATNLHRKKAPADKKDATNDLKTGAGDGDLRANRVLVTRPHRSR